MASTINNIISAIAGMLKTVKPGCVVYADSVPQSFKKNSFYIQLTDHEYGKRIGNRYSSVVTFDIAYFSVSPSVCTDCHETAENVMRLLNTVGVFRPVNVVSRVTDNVLHIMFDVKYSEIEEASFVAMRTSDVNSKIK